MTDTAPEQRLARKCDTCGQEDDHPRHIFDAAIQYLDPISQKTVVEDRSQYRHLDCCNCEHCGITLRHAGDLRGLELAEFVQSKPAELHEELRAAGYDVGS